MGRDVRSGISPPFFRSHGMFHPLHDTYFLFRSSIPISRANDLGKRNGLQGRLVDLSRFDRAISLYCWWECLLILFSGQCFSKYSTYVYLNQHHRYLTGGAQEKNKARNIYQKSVGTRQTEIPAEFLSFLRSPNTYTKKYKKGCQEASKRIA